MSWQAAKAVRPSHGALPVLRLLLLAGAASGKAIPYAAPAPLAAPWPLPQQSGNEGYGPDDNYGSSSGGLNVAGGASGTSSGTFQLSEGAIVAICVVVALVVVFGIASTVLYYIAKKRQWEVRKSISRASRRVTGRLTGRPILSREEEERRARRHGAVRLAQGQSKARRDLEKAARARADGIAPAAATAPGPDDKRPLVREKGPLPPQPQAHAKDNRRAALIVPPPAMRAS